MAFLRLEQVPVKAKRVFIRSDLNVPQDEQGNITEDTRIRSSLPAIRYALEQGAAQVMVTSHLGRPKEGALTAADSLAKVRERMQSLLGTPVHLVQGWVDHAPAPQPGTVLLLENCRGNVGEKKNSEELSRKMASLCDVWVHDAFGTSHRAEATTHGMGLYAPIACAGPLLAAELDALSRALKNPSRPLVAIVGGSKVSTKLTILSNLAEKVDHLILGGGIANTFMLAAGLPIGKSLAEPGLVREASAIMDKMAHKGGKVWLPEDVVCATQFAADATATMKSATAVASDDLILDIGPKTAEAIAAMLQKAGTIVWNGPLGVFEFAPFAHGTRTLALAIARSPAFSIAGGGDTLAAIAAYHVAPDISYISTGGGAFLEFLEGKQLPAVEVLERRGSQ